MSGKSTTTTALIGLVLSIVVGVSAVLALDSIGNSATVAKYFGFYSHKLVLPALLSIAILRVHWQLTFDKQVRRLLPWVATAVVACTAGITIFDYNTPINTLYEMTRLNQAQLLILSVFLSHAALIVQDTSWWKAHWKKVLVSYPFFIFAVCFLTALFPFNMFKEVVKEDKLIEYGQFFVLLAGSCSTAWIAIKLRLKKLALWSVFFAVCALGLFAVAGDEISWGQRILGFETSDALKEVNRQEEVTVHNLEYFEWLVLYAYIALAFFGLTSRWILERVPKLKEYAYLLPSKLLFGYFLFPAIYFFLQWKILWGIWHAWSEVAELFLYTGIVGWLLLLGLTVHRADSTR